MHWEGGLSNCIIATRLRLGCLRTFTFRLHFLAKYFFFMSILHLKIPLIVLNDRHICVMIIKVASYRGAICQYWDWKGAVMINVWPTVLLWCFVMWCTTGLWCDVMDYWVKINWFKIPAASWICWYGDDIDDEDDNANYDDDDERFRRWWWCLLQNFDAALD